MKAAAGWRRWDPERISHGLAADGEGSAAAVARLARAAGGRARSELRMSVSHSSRARAALPRLSAGWAGGEIILHPKVEEALEARPPVRLARWAGSLRAAETHARYVEVSPAGGARRIWMGTASLYSHRNEAEWWIEAVGGGPLPGAGADGPEAFLRGAEGAPGGGGAWVGWSRCVNILDLSAGLGEPLVYACYYLQPDVAAGLAKRGCKLLVAGAQKDINEDMCVRMAGIGVRQWRGHAKLLLTSRGLLLTSLNGSRRPKRWEHSVWLPGDSGAGRGLLDRFAAFPPLEAPRMDSRAWGVVAPLFRRPRRACG